MAPINRRDFFRMGCCGMAVGYAASFSRLGVMNAFAQTQTDYGTFPTLALGAPTMQPAKAAGFRQPP